MPRERTSEVFVHDNTGTYCPDHIPAAMRRRLGDDDIQTWLTYEGGWTEPLICDVCKLAIPVYIDGDEDDEV